MTHSILIQLRNSLFTLALSAALGCGGTMPSPSSAEIGEPVSSEPEVILHLYQMMSNVHEILERQGIDYWVEGGTLLGAVRHQGLIPWDDDLDIGILEKDEDKVFTHIAPFLPAFGYQLSNEYFGAVAFFGYKICPVSGPHVKACLDIFIMSERDGKVFYKYKPQAWGTRNGEPMHYLSSELFPTRLHPFGQFQVRGAHDPRPYLDFTYPADRVTGETWFDIGFQYQSHLGPLGPLGPSRKVKIRFTDANRVPAEPQGPIRPFSSYPLR